MPSLDKADRKVAGEILHSQGSLGYHIVHELYLVAHKQRGGLTDKEYNFLMARHEAIQKELKLLGKLSERCTHGRIWKPNGE